MKRFIPDHDVNSIDHSQPCNPASFLKLSNAASDEEREHVNTLPYKAIIGSLLYLSTMTRPDITYYVTVLCKFMQDPSLDCYKAALGLLLYIHHTKHKFIHYDGDTTTHPGLSQHKHHIEGNGGFVAYSDASWRDSHYTSKTPFTW